MNSVQRKVVCNSQLLQNFVVELLDFVLCLPDLASESSGGRLRSTAKDEIIVLFNQMYFR